MNIASIIGHITLNEKLLTILANKGIPIYKPIIIGIYHILTIVEFFNNNNSLIKSPKINFSFNTNTPYSLYNITHISLTTNNGNRLFL